MGALGLWGVGAIIHDSLDGAGGRGGGSSESLLSSKLVCLCTPGSICCVYQLSNGAESFVTPSLVSCVEASWLVT